MNGFGISSVNFSWTATHGASRYELFADPDGAGPLPDASVDSFDNEGGSQRFGTFNYGEPDVSRFYTTYRLRSCDASGCGAFTAPQTAAGVLDEAAEKIHEFASGYSPASDVQLSRDGLTLYYEDRNGAQGGVFVRSSKADAWQPQAMGLPAFFTYNAVLSADGNTLAIRGNDGLHMHVRVQGSWKEQAVINAASVPSMCAQPCSFGSIKLSDDGSILAVNVTSGDRNASRNGVAIYARNGDAWVGQAYLRTGSSSGTGWFMALSGDGRTLAVNDTYEELRDGPDLSAPQPKVYVFVRNAAGEWIEQARMPADFAFLGDIAADWRSAIHLSQDGNTLAISGKHFVRPGAGGNAAQWGAVNCGDWTQKPEGVNIALFSRVNGIWHKAATMRMSGYPMQMSPDGNELLDGDQLITRHDGVWACPAP